MLKTKGPYAKCGICYDILVNQYLFVSHTRGLRQNTLKYHYQTIFIAQ